MKTTRETTRKRKIEVELTTVNGEYCTFDYFTIYEVRYINKNGERVTSQRFLSEKDAEAEKQTLYEAKVCETAWIMKENVYLN